MDIPGSLHNMQLHPSVTKRPWATISAALVSSAVLLTACGSDNNANGAQASAAAMQQRAVAVTFIEANAQQVRSVRELTGRARAYAEAEIRPQVTGLIQSRLFTEGQPVEAGEALYQIDPAEYRAEVQSANASLRGARATAAAARETAERFEHLAEINAVSRQDYDDAVAAAEQAEAQIGIAQAALSRAEIDLDRTTVRSPISGRIGRSNVTPGALVTANQADTLARVLQLDPIYVDLTTSSADLLRWRQDVSSGRIRSTGEETISVNIELENGVEYGESGTLGFSEVNVDEAAGTVIIRATVPNPDGILLPGMFITASFSAGSYEDVFRIPQRAVQRNQQGGAYVFVVGDGDTAEQRNITILESNGSDWIVSEGLSEGDRVIMSGFQSLRGGAQVNPSPAQSSAE
tara:strand:- start:60600 stop:61817 length:1218 start_codon:yes stop_codon:yes gene_type:complete